MIIDARNKYYTALNQEIKKAEDSEIRLEGVLGQRYIGTGVKKKKILVYGTPGNAMGAYLNQTDITVYCNAQDAVGDTMDSGNMIIHGSCGDTLGYGMRGGSIYVRDNAGYRTGIHMKAYKDQQPVIVIGGCVGAFLGEYQAGGTIVVLGLGSGNAFPAGSCCGSGMHGGTMYIQSQVPPKGLAEQVVAEVCTEQDMDYLLPLIQNYGRFFKKEIKELSSKAFYKLTPGQSNPYNGLYVPY